MVGGSTWIRGSASRTSGAQMVSPISIESTPAMTARSPARAYSRSTRRSPRAPSSLVTRKASGRAGPGQTDHRRPALEAPPFDPADHEPADELVVVERHGLELQRPVDVDLRRRRVLDDGLEQRSQIRARLLRIQRGDSPFGGRVHDGEVELLVAGTHADQEVEDLVHDRVGALLRAIDLVDDEQRPQAVGQRLADDEARLGHHALDGVDEQQHRVHHAENALHLAAEVRVAGRVDEVDAHALELDGRSPWRGS